MDTDDGFLSAVLANPEDKTLRLVYADWLDERGDPRGQFLRTLGQWIGDWGPEEDTDVLRYRLQDLHAVIDPDWRAVMNTLGVKPVPVPLWSESSESPFTEPLVIRFNRGRLGQPGGLITFASQFQLNECPSEGLAADLSVLDDLRLELGDCYAGRSDYPIYTFMAELDAKAPTAADVLVALNTLRNPPRQATLTPYQDLITTDFTEQYFFRHEDTEERRSDEGRGTHGVLSRYVSPAPIWYVLFYDRGGSDSRDAVHLGVARSPSGDRLIGLISGGSW